MASLLSKHAQVDRKRMLLRSDVSSALATASSASAREILRLSATFVVQLTATAADESA